MFYRCRRTLRDHRRRKHQNRISMWISITIKNNKILAEKIIVSASALCPFLSFRDLVGLGDAKNILRISLSFIVRQSCYVTRLLIPDNAEPRVSGQAPHWHQPPLASGDKRPSISPHSLSRSQPQHISWPERDTSRTCQQHTDRASVKWIEQVSAREKLINAWSHLDWLLGDLFDEQW